MIQWIKKQLQKREEKKIEEERKIQEVRQKWIKEFKAEMQIKYDKEWDWRINELANKMEQQYVTGMILAEYNGMLDKDPEYEPPWFLPTQITEVYYIYNKDVARYKDNQAKERSYVLLDLYKEKIKKHKPWQRRQKI
jgi:hypothetical protein